MWTMYTRYRVNIVYNDVLSCLHLRHRDVNDVYTILCQNRLHRCTILFTSSTSRCKRCIHNIVSTSFTTMYYLVYVVYIVDIAIHEMNRNFRLFCSFVVGRNVLSMGVPQSVNTNHLHGVSTKTQVYASNFAKTGEFCVRVHMTLQYTHIISRRFLIAADNVMDNYCDKSQYHVEFCLI